MKIKKMSEQGIVAAIYVALTLVLSAISFGPVQFRVSSMMHQLVAHNKKYAVGLVVGTIIANAFSPLGPIDVLFGTAVSLCGYLIAILINRFVANRTSKCIVLGACVTASTIFVAVELNILYGLPILGTWLTVAAGQALTQIIGCPIIMAISKIVDLGGD